MTVSHFQIGTVSESHYIKSSKFCAWPSISIILGSHRRCSPILTYKAIALSIPIPLFHMFYLAFAASKDLFIIRAYFEHHIIKFVRLNFVEWKCQPLTLIAEYKCESRIALYYCWILKNLFLNVFKSTCWTHESQSLNFATNKQPYMSSRYRLLICSKIQRLTFMCSMHWFKYIQKQAV